MIDITDMDSFLSKTSKGIVNTNDMDAFLNKTRQAPPAPNWDDAKPMQSESFVDSLKQGAKEVGDFVQLGLGTKRFSYDTESQKINDIISQVLADKGEFAGAASGAVAGLSYASKLPVPNPLLKGAAVGLGTAIGAGSGYLIDKGNDATVQGETDAMQNAVMGEAIGAGIPLVAGKVYQKAGDLIADKTTKYIYGQLDPQKARDILELASNKGIRLLPNQVADNKTIDQLVAAIGQNPVHSQRINTINKENKNALMHELNLILNEAGIDSIALRSADNIDPLGDGLKRLLQESKDGRTKEIQQAYKVFEMHAGAFSVPSKPIVEEITKLKELAPQMPNPEKYENAINYVLGKLDVGKVNSLDLNAVSKQINYMVKNLPYDEYATKSGLSKVKDIVDGALEDLSKTDGSYSQLQTAKKLYADKRGIYDRQEIRAVLDGKKDPETIYDTLLRGDNSVTNAKIVKDELLRTQDGEKILGTLARRQIDESLYKVRLGQNIFHGNELDTKAFLKVMDNIDYRQLEILGGKEMVDSLHNMRKLVELVNKQDNLLSGQGGGLHTMGMIKQAGMNALAQVFRIKTVGEVLTSDIAHNKMLDILRASTREVTPNKTPSVIEGINQKQKEIIDALQ